MVFTAWLSALKLVDIAYSGLVPMSPKTTPMAPSASAAMPRVAAGRVRAVARSELVATARRYPGARATATRRQGIAIKDLKRSSAQAANRQSAQAANR